MEKGKKRRSEEEKKERGEFRVQRKGIRSKK